MPIQLSTQSEPWRPGYNIHAKEFRPTPDILEYERPFPPPGWMESTGFPQLLETQQPDTIDVVDDDCNPLLLPESPSIIQDVWRDTLEEAVDAMSQLVADGYTVVAMDTEFPGVVAHARVASGDSSLMWQTIRANVNMLKIIQLGLSFTDADGKPPPGRCGTFQINFCFDLDQDMYAIDSIELLASSGIEFEQLRLRGCDSAEFAELLISSGLVLNDEVTWVSFHSGYDYGYLLRLLTNEELGGEPEFFDLLSMFFPNMYDTKYLAKLSDNLQYVGGLDSLAGVLSVERVGPAHQAGSDALLTGKVFFGLVKEFFLAFEEDHSIGANIIFGLGDDARTPLGASLPSPLEPRGLLDVTNIHNPSIGKKQPNNFAGINCSDVGLAQHRMEPIAVRSG